MQMKIKNRGKKTESAAAVHKSKKNLRAFLTPSTVLILISIHGRARLIIRIIIILIKKNEMVLILAVSEKRVSNIDHSWWKHMTCNEWFIVFSGK